ncbi:MAG: TolC family protein [Nitrospinota bacterium]|nr:TolC family protein [Nitrospinota bacterium]
MRRVFLILSTLMLLTPEAQATDKHAGHFKHTLNTFIETAKKQNPNLLEANNRINIYKQIPDQRSSWNDPMLTFGLANLPVDTFSFRQEAMTQKQVQLTQEIPFPGKTALRKEAADKDVSIVGWNLKELELKIIRQVKESFFELCFINSAIETTEQNKILLKQFVTIAESKYSVGKGIQQDVLKAQVELSKIMDELIELRQLQASETAKLNILMNRLPQEPLEIPHGLTQTDFKLNIETLQGLAEKNRPFLQGIQSAINKFTITKELAEKEYYPNFQVGVRYGQRQDSPFQDHPDFVTGFIGVNIPIWFATKQRKKVAEENYRILTAKDSYNAARNDVFLKIKLIMDKEIKGQKLISLIKTGIIPQARQSLESALAAYSVDKIDFLTLIDNQVTLLNWEIKYHRQLTDYEQNLAALEHVVGQSLF